MFGTNTVHKGDSSSPREPVTRPPSSVVWTEPLVFVNYRGQDEKPAADIEATLTRRLGRGVAFRDVRMRAGTRFPRELKTRAARSEVMLSIIGERWDDPHTLALLHDPEDWVHREIATALRYRVPVVPILVGARPRLSANQLPDDIRLLADIQGPHLSRDYGEADVERLIDRLLHDVPPLATAAYRHH
ncbi:TIR domain-containing protein [Actinophytocola sp. KF-1]